MSASSTMTCEHCGELLTELACAELDAGTAALVRAHAESCDTCGPELLRLTRVLHSADSLPLETPSRSVEDRVMQAARDALAQRAAGAQAVESSEPSGGSLRRFLERLGSWAMSPQVAMAAVLLLVVGIGLYSLPLGKDAAAPSSLQLAQEEPSAPAASATAAPVEPPADKASEADMRADEYAPAEPAVAEQLAARDEPQSGAPDNATVNRKRRSESLHDDYAPKAVAPSKQALAAPKGGSLADDGDALGGVGGASGAAYGNAERESGSAFAPPPPAPAAASAPASSQSASGSVAEETVREGAARASDESKRSPGADSLAAGLGAAQRGAYAQAVPLLEGVLQSTSLSSAERASAQLWLARSLRALDQCKRALVYYVPLTRAPRPSRAVLEEAASCYDQLGETAQASDLRARSETKPASKSAKPATSKGDTY